MSEENKVIVRRFIEEVINEGNMDVLSELVHCGVVFGVLRGLEAFMQVVAPFFTAFPDLNTTIEDMISEGDRVVCRFTVRATHQGEFMGLPPTRTQVTWTGQPIYRIADGKIVEEWFLEDHLALMQQLGGIPAPSEQRVEPSH